MVRASSVITPQVTVEWASWDAHRTSRVEGSPASSLEVPGTMTGVGGPNYLEGSATATARSADSGGPRSGGHGKVLGMEDDSPFLVTCEQLDP